MLSLYRISIFFYHFLIKLLAPFNSRAKLFFQERKNVFHELEEEFHYHPGHLIWFHAASLGEFEQALPVIEKLKAERTNLKVLLTFFSPSGYQQVRNNPLLDYVHYLPEDSPNNAVRFLNLIRPEVAIFVKYELWYFFLTELKKREVPVLLISGIFRKNQLYFHPSGRFYQPAFKSFTHFFIQDEFSGILLRRIGFRNFSVTGDTRFDRVLSVATSDFRSPLIDRFIENAEKVIVMGSVWPSDMEILWPLFEDAISKSVKIIIAPHHVDASALQAYQRIDGHVFFTQTEEEDLSEKRVLIIDKIGLLSKTYRYANVAIVGGAFRGTLHNVLEPAVYGIPVLFGAHENNEKFIEAQELQNAGGGFTFENYKQLSVQLNKILMDKQFYKQTCLASEGFVQSRAGASSKIVSMIKEWI